MFFFFLFQGVRSRSLDACASKNPCKNEGECIPTDNGPVCDCSKVDFKGLFCQEGESLIPWSIINRLDLY